MSARRALVCALMPEYDRDSGSRRVLHLLEFLQEAGWAVSFVSQHPNPGARYVRTLQRRGIDVYAGSKDWADQLIATGRYDLAVFGLWDIAEPHVPRLRRRSPGTRIIVDSIDLHFLRQARRIFGESAGNGSSGVLDAGYASDMIRELNTYAAADAVLAVSQKEADLINDLTGDPRLAYAVPDGEDVSPSTLPLEQRRGLVFVGCYRFAPNAKAVEYLCKEILPRVDPTLLADHPVYIVGDGLDDTVRGFGSELPYVRMVGWVPSVEPYVTQTRVSVVPLLYGAGTKRKVLQSLMYGSPTVSTSIGAEGLNLQHGEQVLIADDPVTFAESITRLLRDDELWRHLAHEGLAYMTAARGRHTARASLMHVVSGVLSRDAKPEVPAGLDQNPVQPFVDPEEYQQLVYRIRDVVQTTLPADAGVVVVSKGDAALLELGERRTWHFPQDADGEYAGSYPGDSEEAIRQLERLSVAGGEYLLFPATALWWLDHYVGFKEYLDRHYHVVLDQTDTCVVYARQNRATESQPVSAMAVSGMETPAPAERSGEDGGTRLIAFFLPQFHPIPENDTWWGKGFTEWTNVANATPLFPGHYQPRLPADLGFYDLRLPEVRQAQAQLAGAYGLHGFCYYHYWFGGKRLLDRPFAEVLSSGAPDFPFCLCWANEPWSRRWDGTPRDVLQPQSYSDEDDLSHIRWLLPALADPRAIRIDGKPVFLVYQGRELPDPARTTDTWRAEVLRAGLEEGLYLIACETGWDAGWDATAAGFDAKLLFQPQFAILFGSGAQIPAGSKEGLRVYDYAKAWPVLANPDAVSYRRYDTVCPGWDNSARAGDRAVVLHNSTPEAYQNWLQFAVAKVERQPPDQRVVFINAWNEWAEGCYLEPDSRHGRAYLEATKRVLVSHERSASQGVASDAGGDVAGRLAAEPLVRTPRDSRQARRWMKRAAAEGAE